MTDVVVERLRIACRADPRRRDDALATRSRLAAVARNELPRALLARVHAWPDVALGSLSVRLDFDPATYDDVTLAVLWADRIGAAVERAGQPTRSGAGERGDRHRGSASGGPPRGPRAGDPARIAVDAHGARGEPTPTAPWAVALLDLAVVGDTAALQQIAAALADPGVRARVLDAIPSGEHAGLAQQLEALAAASVGRGEDERRNVPAPRTADRRSATDDEGADSRKASAVSHAARARLASAAGLVERAGRERERAAAPRPRATVLATECAGLVLAYPWLGRLLEDAALARPLLDPIDARRLALAAVAGRDGAAADPLVRLLAGDVLADPHVPPTGDSEPEAAAVAADAILGRLASALPGFARSSPEFIRRELVVRPGTLDPAVDPIPVTLAPAPLDVVLPLLPYPLGLFRLAWTPTLAIRAGNP